MERPLKSLDIFAPVPHDGCVARKLCRLFPEAAGRAFVRVKVFDSTSLCYFDGHEFYWWTCFCKPCKQYWARGWMADVPPRSSAAAASSDRTLPYSLEKLSPEHFFAEHGCLLYSTLFADGCFVFPELTRDLTKAQVAQHRKQCRRAQRTKERRENPPRDKKTWQQQRKRGRQEKAAERGSL